MRIEEGIIDGDVTVDEDFILNGTALGNILVVSGGSLELNGTCSGDLILEPEASVKLRGSVAGFIRSTTGAQAAGSAG